MTKLATIGAAVVAAVALVVGLVAVLIGGGDDRSDRGALLVVPEDARARIDGPSARRTVGKGDYELATGDRVEALVGSSRVELAREGALELRAGFRGSDSLTPENTLVRIDSMPALLAGELLVLAHSGPVDVGSAGTVLRVEGVARVSRSLSLGVGVYRDQVAVESAGRTVDVPAYRQVAIADLGLVPGRPVPFVYDERDPWDQRFLGEAIDLTKRLDGIAGGYTPSLRASSRATLFRTIVSELLGEETLIDQDPCTVRTPGECLVGSGIAVEGRNGSFEERVGEVFAFRGEGAAWGLVALDQQVVGDSLLARLDQIINPSDLLFAAGGATSTELPRSVSDAPPPGGDVTPPPTTTTAPPPTTTTTEPVIPTIPTIPPPLNEATDPVEELVGGLLPDDSPLDLSQDNTLVDQVEGALREDQLVDAAPNPLG